MTGEAEATHPNSALGCDPLGSPSDVDNEAKSTHLKAKKVKDFYAL